VVLAAFSGDKPAVLPILQPVLKQEQTRTGLLRTEYGLLLLAARPILTTQGTGPARGVLVFGRFLDAPLLRALAEQTKVAFELFPAADPRLSPEERDYLTDLQPSEPLLRPGPDGAFFVYEMLPDLEGKPAALIRTPIRQEISTVARNTSRILMGTLGLVALALLLGGAYFSGRIKRDVKINADAAAWGTTALTVLIGLTLTAGVFLEFRQRSREALERRFQLVAAERAGIIIEKFRGNLRNLDAVRRFFNGSEFVSRQEFHRFAMPILEYRDFRALEWIPRVAREQRAEFEAAARKDGLAGFQFTEQDPEGRLVPAGDRDVYFPVYYLEPYAGNEAVMGFSPDSIHPARGAALLRAWDSGQLTLTERYVLVQETAQRFSVLAFAPVYRGGEDPLGVEERRKRLKGFVLGVIRIGDVVENALTNTKPQGLVLRLTDLSAPVEQQQLYTWRPRVGAEQPVGDSPFLYRQDFPMADRIWQIEVHPTAAFIADNTDRIYRWVPVVGALLTLLAALYLFGTGSQRRRAEALVAVRTTELGESERRYRQLFEMNPEPMWVYDLETLAFLAVNDMAVHKYGYSREEFLRMTIADIRPPEDVLRLLDNVARVTEGVDEAGVWRHRKRDGTVIAVEIVSHNLLYEGRKAELVLALDITERQRAMEALRASEQKLADILDNMLDAVYSVDVRSNILLQTNPAISRIFGRPQEDFFANPFLYLDMVHPEDRELAKRSVSEILEQKEGEWIYRIVRPNGEVRWVTDRARLITDAQGGPLRVDCYFTDITARKRLEERQRLAAAVFEAVRESIIVTDVDGNIVAVNPAFTTLSGYTEAEVLGQNPRLLKSGRQSGAYYAAVWQTVAREGAWQGEFWNRRKDGGLYLTLATISQVRDAAGRLAYYVGIATDITQQKEAEQRIERLAYYDALTDLPNRALLAQRAELALALAARRGEELAMLFLDLDRFKEVNDSLGHAEGDALLVQVAARLKGLTREADTVCRLGGDEFVLLLSDNGRAGALRVADKVLAAFRQPFDLAGHRLHVTVSIGIALYPHDGANFGDLLKNADAALYRAKQDGRNTRAFYAREMNIATFERLVLEAELRKAIELGQLRAYFQPKLRLSDGWPVGAEALVRWQHPDHGLIPPGRFIPVAEASDLIVALGDWMLEEVCRQLAVWCGSGPPTLSVAVNLTARHFREPGFIEYIENLLAVHGLPPQTLELELTESSLLEAGAQTAETLLALRRLGVGLAIDDFGTGYSSLNYLKRLPITALKIDQSFVRDLVTDPDDRILAATIVNLGHSLGLKVVAEGVETEEQRRILLEQGCDLAQGYLFGPPMPVDQFVEWFGRQGAPLGSSANVALQPLPPGSSSQQ
jgi:diguanylate cyclase (GGDEF)-like protein/PAS domain S-box-containing protein